MQDNIESSWTEKSIRTASETNSDCVLCAGVGKDLAWGCRNPDSCAFKSGFLGILALLGSSEWSCLCSPEGSYEMGVVVQTGGCTLLHGVECLSVECFGCSIGSQ